MRHTINVPGPGTPLHAEVVSIDGVPRIVLREGPILIGEFADVTALTDAGVNLADVTMKQAS